MDPRENIDKNLNSEVSSSILLSPIKRIIAKEPPSTEIKNEYKLHEEIKENEEENDEDPDLYEIPDQEIRVHVFS